MGTSKSFSVITVFVVGVAIFAIWALAPLIVWAVTPVLMTHFAPDMEKSGQFGDLFGSINALFSGLAFGGIIVAILLQREELKLQREELASTRRELQRTADTQERQFSDSRIIQRAYLSANPEGIRRSDRDETLLAHVEIRNVGHLPAKDVTWFVQLFLSQSGDEQINLEQRPFKGNNVVPPGAKMSEGSNGIRLGEVLELERRTNACFLYVCGQIRYDDGFGHPRFTNFCHRYNFTSAKTGGVRHEVTDARFHHSGNDAN
jgi:hypothetical protein